MSTPEQKKQWKKDAELLKKDLAGRQKVIKKREVEIKFPKQSPTPPKSTGHTKNLDHFYKNQINFEQ